MKSILYIVFFLLGFLVSCTDQDGNEVPARQVELFVLVDDFLTNTRASSPSSIAEEKIENLYVFLFPTSSGQTLQKYYIGSSSFAGGSWNSTSKKIILNLAQAEAGTRDVCIVANCSDLQTSLDGVVSKSELQNMFKETANPWSTNLGTPLMMVGNKTHNFNASYQLDAISLERTVAKLQLNITLTSEFQTTPTIHQDGALAYQYQYRYVNFDKSTYVIKPNAKLNNLTESMWANWDSNNYVLNSSGHVTAFTLDSYINERDASTPVSKIELKLPRTQGVLPPPEFGDDVYTLSLASPIRRNTFYVYDITLGN